MFHTWFWLSVFGTAWNWVLIGALAPKSLGMTERFMIWGGGVATIFTALFFFLKAKVWKKA